MSTSIIELDDIIRRHAWNTLKKKCNFVRRAFLNEADYVCQVDWSSLSIEHKVSKFTPKEKDNTPIETNWGNVVTGARWVPLWSCDFDNKADAKQAHAFRGSRDTTTWVDVDLEQCYTVDKEVSVEVNIPPNFSKFRAGRDNSLSLNKVKGQVFKEVLTWEVNSQVEVLPGWRAHAQLLAREECSSIEFEIRTTLYNPKGIVPVTFVRKSDKRVAYTVEIDDFREAFRLVADGGVLTPEEKSCVEVMMTHTVNSLGLGTSAAFPQIITKGSCVCLSWSDQKVDIKTSPLSGEESSHDGDRKKAPVTQNSISEHKFTIKSY
ncbi:uncharacterized protein LOC101857719 [Aplysia californica]|uniref:Uncharacterized protein LOC101857719 n=1 Tax=Aplysia californica TaxID=6500 RepID=A0ABM1A0J8_APLCA|nr:uncharacterized protein LOC101857719 [Aplysia californica]